jgi:hypothetical protein
MAARYSANQYMALPNVVAPAHPDPDMDSAAAL